MKVRDLLVLSFTAATAAALATAVNDSSTGLPSLNEEDFVDIEFGHDGTNYWCIVTYVGE